MARNNFNFFKGFKYLVITIALLFFISILFISIDGLTDRKQSSANKNYCMLILGNKVNEDGTLSQRLKSRLDKGYEIFLENNMPIIVSGGLGKEGYYEGDEMKKYLVSREVPADHIIIDNAGINTLESVKNYILLTSNLECDGVVAVSQFFHISRITRLFKNNGVPNISTAHADYYELRDLYSLVREVFALYKYW